MFKNLSAKYIKKIKNDYKKKLVKNISKEKYLKKNTV